MNAWILHNTDAHRPTLQSLRSTRSAAVPTTYIHPPNPHDSLMKVRLQYYNSMIDSKSQVRKHGKNESELLNHVNTIIKGRAGSELRPPGSSKLFVILLPHRQPQGSQIEQPNIIHKE